jgi:hypothetical protein
LFAAGQLQIPTLRETFSLFENKKTSKNKQLDLIIKIIKFLNDLLTGERSRLAPTL